MNVHTEREQWQAMIDQALASTDPSVFNLSKDQASALYHLGYHLYENGKYLDSKQVFRFLTICEPFASSYWMGLGASSHMMKEYALAIECYSVAAVQNAQDPYVHLHAANCFFELKQISQALRALESAITVAKTLKQNALSLRLQEMHRVWVKLV